MQLTTNHEVEPNSIPKETQKGNIVSNSEEVNLDDLDLPVA